MENKNEPLGEEELDNLRTMIRDNPLAGIAMLSGSSRARMSINIKEVAEVFTGPHKAVHAKAAKLLEDFYPEALDYFQSYKNTLTEEEEIVRDNLEKWPGFSWKKALASPDKAVRAKALGRASRKRGKN